MVIIDIFSRIEGCPIKFIELDIKATLIKELKLKSEVLIKAGLVIKSFNRRLIKINSLVKIPNRRLGLIITD